MHALAKKLRMKPGQRIGVFNAPPKYVSRLQSAVGDLTISTRGRGRGPFDLIQVFAADVGQLERVGPKALEALGPDGIFWLCYPKRSSAMASDLWRDSGWQVLDEAGWRPVSQVAVDDTWSALRFRPAAAVKSATRPRPR